ncbi:MAG: dTDP-glucose 4,6-dehydratase [Candidatus Omnitrophica bacterium]|nr:dTDP-glucose 4,6-dehydratase [Candidatus Omnitrophota bacterium]
MKILVTGGAGFIGSNFILYWMKNHPQDDVINFDALTYAGNLKNLSSIENHSRYRFIQGDITDSDVVTQAIQGVETVVHFAAESHVDRSILGPAIFTKTNILGTQVLLDAALAAGVKRFHHVSTDEVFGALELKSKDKFDEQTPYDPRSPYAASKAASDHLVRAYFHTYGLPVTITNCSNNYGPFQYPEKLISLAITNILEGKKIPVYGDGLYVRDWLYVEDHCRAIDLVLSQAQPGETYCVGGLTEDISNRDVIKLILKDMGKADSMMEPVKDRPGHDRRYAMDWSKIHRELGWKPSHDFETYLKQTIEWYRQEKAWWQPIKSGEYQNYYRAQYAK